MKKKILISHHVDLIVEQFMMVNGRVQREMGMVCKYGQMERSMKEFGLTIKHVEKENFFILMAIFLKVNGKMIRQMVMEFIDIVMELFMKGVGSRIFKMGTVQKLGQIIPPLSVCIKKEKNMVKADINGQTVVIMMVIGQII